MKGLLIKDLKLFLGTRNLFVVCIGLFLIFVGDTPDMGVSYTLFILVFLTISLISYDEFDNGMPFLLTLPGGKKTYVTERYVFTWLTSTVSAILLSLLSAGLILIRGGGRTDVSELFFTTVLIYAITTIFCSIMIPFMFQFGAEKGRFIMMGLIGCVYLFVMVAANYLDSHEESLSILNGIFGKLGVLSGIQIVGILLVSSLVILGISWVVSQKVMEKKEF